GGVANDTGAAHGRACDSTQIVQGPATDARFRVELALDLVECAERALTCDREYVRPTVRQLVQQLEHGLAERTHQLLSDLVPGPRQYPLVVRNLVPRHASRFVAPARGVEQEFHQRPDHVVTLLGRLPQ